LQNFWGTKQGLKGARGHSKQASAAAEGVSPSARRGVPELSWASASSLLIAAAKRGRTHMPPPRSYRRARATLEKKKISERDVPAQRSVGHRSTADSCVMGAATASAGAPFRAQELSLLGNGSTGQFLARCAVVWGSYSWLLGGWTLRN